MTAVNIQLLQTALHKELLDAPHEYTQ